MVREENHHQDLAALVFGEGVELVIDPDQVEVGRRVAQGETLKALGHLGFVVGARAFQANGQHSFCRENRAQHGQKDGNNKTHIHELMGLTLNSTGYPD